MADGHTLLRYLEAAYFGTVTWEIVPGTPYERAILGEVDKTTLEYLNAHQQDFMQEDTQAGMIYAYLEDYTGDRVCSKQLYEEALGNLNSPADWETRAICEIMNTGIAGGIIQGWVAYKSPKRYKKYGSQKGWERVNQAPPEGDGFQEITEEEARQMELPF